MSVTETAGVCAFVHVCMCACMCVHVSVCVFVCVCVCVCDFHANLCVGIVSIDLLFKSSSTFEIVSVKELY